MLPKGWFDIHGVRRGDRTLVEQMQGLDQALAEAPGATVCDLGCAEGAIALEFAKAGARSVYGCDSNGPFIGAAQQLAAQLPVHHQVARFEHLDINLLVRDANGQKPEQYDIVLALAVLHKLHWPDEAAAYVAGLTARLLVVRLPFGSKGAIESKHFRGRRVDLNKRFPERGLVLERTEPGPRDELVQYWRRPA